MESEYREAFEEIYEIFSLMPKEFQEVEKALEEEIREKYNPNDIFKNRNKTISEETQAPEDTRITVVQEEKWYQKLFNLIKNLFDRNK